MFVGGLISDKQLDHALDEQLTIQSSEGLTYDVAPEFTKVVVDQADEFIPTDQLFRGGLDIITSLDYELQNQIECTIKSQSARITGGADQNPDEAGLEACDMARLLPSPKKGDSIPTGEFRLQRHSHRSWYGSSSLNGRFRWKWTPSRIDNDSIHLLDILFSRSQPRIYGLGYPCQSGRRIFQCPESRWQFPRASKHAQGIGERLYCSSFADPLTNEPGSSLAHCPTDSVSTI